MWELRGPLSAYRWTNLVMSKRRMLTLPSAFFDAYTIVFGIRNVTHIDMALAEAYRVLRPAGRFFLELARTGQASKKFMMLILMG